MAKTMTPSMNTKLILAECFEKGRKAEAMEKKSDGLKTNQSMFNWKEIQAQQRTLLNNAMDTYMGIVEKFMNIGKSPAVDAQTQQFCREKALLYMEKAEKIKGKTHMLLHDVKMQPNYTAEGFQLGSTIWHREASEPALKSGNEIYQQFILQAGSYCIVFRNLHKGVLKGNPHANCEFLLQPCDSHTKAITSRNSLPPGSCWYRKITVAQSKAPSNIRVRITTDGWLFGLTVEVKIDMLLPVTPSELTRLASSPAAFDPYAPLLDATPHQARSVQPHNAAMDFFNSLDNLSTTTPTPAPPTDPTGHAQQQQASPVRQVAVSTPSPIVPAAIHNIGNPSVHRKEKAAAKQAAKTEEDKQVADLQNQLGSIMSKNDFFKPPKGGGDGGGQQQQQAPTAPPHGSAPVDPSAPPLPSHQVPMANPSSDVADDLMAQLASLKIGGTPSSSSDDNHHKRELTPPPFSPPNGSSSDSGSSGGDGGPSHRDNPVVLPQPPQDEEDNEDEVASLAAKLAALGGQSASDYMATLPSPGGHHGEDDDGEDDDPTEDLEARLAGIAGNDDRTPFYADLNEQLRRNHNNEQPLQDQEDQTVRCSSDAAEKSSTASSHADRPNLKINIEELSEEESQYVQKKIEQLQEIQQFINLWPKNAEGRAPEEEDFLEQLGRLPVDPP